jgi:hypothetical protein
MCFGIKNRWNNLGPSRSHFFFLATAGPPTSFGGGKPFLRSHSERLDAGVVGPILMICRQRRRGSSIHVCASASMLLADPLLIFDQSTPSPTTRLHDTANQQALFLAQGARRQRSEQKGAQPSQPSASEAAASTSA